MRWRAVGLSLLGALLPAPLSAQTPVDGRIIRVVYQVINERGPRNATWGFHLAHMQDGRYCVRLGNPGRLTLAIIRKVGDICFDTIPGSVDRSSEQRSRSYDAREKGKRITLISYQKGSVARSGNDVTLDITTCNRIEASPARAVSPTAMSCTWTGRSATRR